MKCVMKPYFGLMIYVSEINDGCFVTLLLL